MGLQKVGTCMSDSVPSSSASELWISPRGQWAFRAHLVIWGLISLASFLTFPWGGAVTVWSPMMGHSCPHGCVSLDSTFQLSASSSALLLGIPSWAA